MSNDIDVEAMKARVLEESEASLAELQETTNTGVEQGKKDFSQYLKETGIGPEFSRDSGIGKFLRTFRYYDEIKNFSTEHTIPLDHFFGLKMIEGECDPTNINENDGGAGISQIQPDTFKWFAKDRMGKDWKVFSDNPEYEQWDYNKLLHTINRQTKKKYTRLEANQAIAQKLIYIKERKFNYDFQKLSDLDDRFNPQIALDFSAEYLKYCKSKIDIKTVMSEPLKSYAAKYKGFDFVWLLALNGYNKGPDNYDNNVYDPQRDKDKKRLGKEDPKAAYKDHHLNNLTNRITQYREYSALMEGRLAQGLSGNALMNEFRKLAGTSPRVEIKDKNKNINGIQHLDYIGISKDKQWNIYKFALPSADKIATNMDEFLMNFKLYDTFKGKILEFTDEKGKPFSPLHFPYQPGDSIYIREKL